MGDKVQIREVGLRDGLQSIAEILPTETEDRLARRRIRRRGARDRGQLVRAAEAAAATRRRRGGRAPRADLARAHRLGADPEPQRRRARPGARRARDEFRAVGQRGAQRVECPPQHRRVDRGFPPRRGAVPRAAAETAPAHRLRPRHRLRLHDRGRCRRGPGAPHRRSRSPRPGPTAILLADTVGYGQPARDRARFPPGHRRCRAVAGIGAFPRHARARPRQCAGGAQRRLRAPSMPRWAGSAVAPTRRARPATSSSRTSPSCSRRWAFETGIDIERLVAVRELVARALPDVTQHGAIAKAGLPRNFHPVAQAASTPCAGCRVLYLIV